MLADQDDPLGTEATTEPAPATPEPRLVVIYRRKGVPWLLIPPLLLLAAVGGIIGYRRSALPEPRIIYLPAPVADVSKLLAKAEPPAVVPVAPQPTAAPEPATNPAQPPVAPVESAIKVDPVPAPRPSATASPFDPVPIADLKPPLEPAMPPKIDPVPAAVIGSPIEPQPVAPGVMPGASPFDPPREVVDPPKRDAVGFDPDAAKVVLPPAAPAANDAPGDVTPSPADARRARTKEALDDMQLEAEARIAERNRLEAAKPELLQGDPREAKLRRNDLILGARRIAEEDRPRLHAKLHAALVEHGNNAGVEIKAIADEFGRDTLPEIIGPMTKDLVGPASRLTPQGRIQRMRRWGLPETMILDDIAEHEEFDLRGGEVNPGRTRRSATMIARNRDQAWVRAAKILLSIPPRQPQPQPEPAATRADPRLPARQ